MSGVRLTTVVLALASVTLAHAAEPPRDPAKELQGLKERLAALEKALEETRAASAAAAAAAAPEPTAAGMTAEQEAELARVTVKTEGMEDARDSAGFKGLKIAGYADPAFVYNHARRRAGFQFVTPIAAGFDPVQYTYSNSNFGAAMLDLQKEMDGGTRWRLTIMPARSTTDVFGEGGIVHEASVSIPLTDLQTRLIAGQLPDWSGYEYLPAPQNKLVTHNLLFDFTLPIAYTGIGLEKTTGPFVVKAMVANMSGTHRRDGEYIPVVAYRVDYSGGEYWGVGLAGANGYATNWNLDYSTDPNGTFRPDSRVDVVELDAYYIRGNITLNAQLGAGRQQHGAVTPAADGSLREARWLGASALAAYKLTPRFEAIVRADFIYNEKNGGGVLTYPTFDGQNGFGPAYGYTGVAGSETGVPAGVDVATLDPDRGANRYAVAAGVSFAFNPNTAFKLEYRLDGATEPTFEHQSDGSYSKLNHVVASSVVVSF